MTQQEAEQLSNQITQEMPLVKVEMKQHIRHKVVQYRLKLEHTKKRRTLPVLKSEDWEEIKELWAS